jgi:hypothetical protein
MIFLLKIVLRQGGAKRRSPMSLKFAALGGLTVLSALGSPARVDEQAQNLGPVKPYEPTLITFGHGSSATKRKSMLLEEGEKLESRPKG